MSFYKNKIKIENNNNNLSHFMILKEKYDQFFPTLAMISTTFTFHPSIPFYLRSQMGSTTFILH